MYGKESLKGLAFRGMVNPSQKRHDKDKRVGKNVLGELKLSVRHGALELSLRHGNDTHRWSLLTLTLLPPLLSSLLNYNRTFQPSAIAANPISAAPVASVSPPVVGRHLPHFFVAADFLTLSTATFSHPLPSAVLARMTAALFFLCMPQPHPSPTGAAIFLHCFQLRPLIALICCLQPHQRSAMPPAAHSSVVVPPLSSLPPLLLLPQPPFCRHRSNPTSFSARHCHL
ncbi:hypothetical protein BHM03_00042934 [Ensete ventricosum]|nr:hypothetical protein BHM03_00042934 [Ensete ventricosum]